MRTLIVGVGEVGSALNEILRHYYDVQTIDLEYKKILKPIEIMHICLRYSDKFTEIVRGYISEYEPKYVDICTTCPIGTTEVFGMDVCHSTTRGLHPNLKEGLLNITKHVGGGYSDVVAEYFRGAGIDCITHKRSRTTEAAHVLSNIAYGVNIVLADELYNICREYGLDYKDVCMKYTETNNEGYERLGNGSKVRPILTPPNGKIGGHCVKLAAELIPDKLRQRLVRTLFEY